MHLTNNNSNASDSLAATALAVDAGAPEAEIEVTDEMIEAGRLVFIRFNSRFDDEEDAVRDIYRSMELARLRVAV